MILSRGSLPLFHFDEILGGKGDDPALYEGHEDQRPWGPNVIRQ